MLYFEVARDGKEIRISFDEDGGRILAARIDQVLRSREHKHLLAPSAGGKELSAKTLFGTEAISEVILMKIEH